MSHTSLDHFVIEVRETIANGETEQALDQLKSFLPSRAPELYDEVLIHVSRYSRLRRNERKGLLNSEQFEVEQNKLNNALLELLHEIPTRIESKMFPLRTDVAMTTDIMTAPEEVMFEKILGINNLKQIAWIERGLQASRSVCRVLTPDGVGTGFLVGSGLMMTNSHVIPDISVATRSVVEFNYQQDASGQFLPTVRYALDPSRFHTSPLPKLDYSLVGVVSEPNRPKLEDWGYLTLNANADPVPAEHVTIIQHPNGGLKQIVLTANWVIATKAHLLHYTTDTMPGSSGSPVFNDSWHVIALHHAGGQVHVNDKGERRFVNEGILMSVIKPDAGEYWPG